MLQGAEPGEHVADPGEPAVDVGDDPQARGDLGQLLGGERGADGGSSDGASDVDESGQRRRQAGRQGVGHLGGEGLAVADLARVGARFQGQGRLAAQRGGGIGGDERSDAVELKQLQRMRIHDTSATRPGSAGFGSLRQSRPVSVLRF